MHRPTDDVSLGEARAWLRDHLEEGAKCPCCTQMAKVYRRKLNKTMVKALRLLRDAGAAHKFVHAPTVLHGEATAARDVGKLAMWGLAVEERTPREDGGRAGWWQVTPLGLEFLRGERSVERYAKVYDGRVLGHTGEYVTIADVAPEFRLDELMAGV